MYRVRVIKGNKILNVKVGDSVKNFYEGDVLPEDYTPPEDYIKNKIVEVYQPETSSKRGK